MAPSIINKVHDIVCNHTDLRYRPRKQRNHISITAWRTSQVPLLYLQQGHCSTQFHLASPRPQSACRCHFWKTWSSFDIHHHTNHRYRSVSRHKVFQDSLACSNHTREQTTHGARTWSGELIRELPEFLAFRTVRKKWPTTSTTTATSRPSPLALTSAFSSSFHKVLLWYWRR